MALVLNPLSINTTIIAMTLITTAATISTTATTITTTANITTIMITIHRASTLARRRTRQALDQATASRSKSPHRPRARPISQRWGDHEVNMVS